MKQRDFVVELGGTRYPVSYITELETAKKAIKQLESIAKDGHLLGLDIETMRSPSFENFKQAALYSRCSLIRLVQITWHDADRSHTWVFDCLHMVSILSDLENLFKIGEFVCHNAVFEIEHITHHLPWLRGHFNPHCTQLMATILYHATHPDDARKFGLENVTRGLLGIDISKYVQDSDWSVKNLTFEQIRYASIDAILPPLLHELLDAALDRRKLSKYNKLVQNAKPATAEMRQNGMKINEDDLQELIDAWTVELNKKAKILNRELGGTTARKLSDAILNGKVKGIPLRDIKKWERTKAKAETLRTGKEVLIFYAHIPIVDTYLKHQKVKTRISTFGTKLLAKVKLLKGRLHGSIWLEGARTGRMSSSGPNMQNAPKLPEFRDIFQAPTGKVFVSADYSQIELRIMAEISQDKAMLLAFKNREDIHVAAAQGVLRKSSNYVPTDKERKSGKIVNFGTAFGMGPPKLSQNAYVEYEVVMSEDEARDMLDAWKEKFKGYADHMKRTAKIAEKTLRATTVGGKIRRLDSKTYYGAGLNTPVQGGAGCVMLAALDAVHRLLVKYDMQTTVALVVHDDLILEVPEREVKKASKILYKAMTYGWRRFFPEGVQTGVVSEICVGRKWGSLKKYDVEKLSWLK